MEFFKIRQTIPFMRHALVFNVISAITFALAVFFLVHRGLNFSIEFLGGTTIEVQYPQAADVDKLRSALIKGGFPDSQVQTFGTSRDVLLRLPLKKDQNSANIAEEAIYALAIPGFEGEVTDKSSASQTVIQVRYKQSKDAEQVRATVQSYAYRDFKVEGSGTTYVVTVPDQKDDKATPQIVADHLKKALVNLDYEGKPRRVEFVGPQVGDELANYGAVALLLTAFAIVIYLWFRFEWRFGLAAIIANLHDVVIILGFFAFFQWEFSLPVLAAVLAVLGYSVNESVVVFDRVRENFRKMRKAETPEVINSAITGVISRTIITHLCTQIMVTTMLIWGGPALHYFAVALTIGICFGIYSSVLVASPLLMWLGVDRGNFTKPPPKARGRDEHEGAVV